MNSVEKSIILKNLDYLTTSSTNLTQLSVSLLSDELLTVDDLETINSEVTQTKQYLCLYLTTLRKGPDAFQKLLTCLHASGNEDVAKELSRSYENSAQVELDQVCSAKPDTSSSETESDSEGPVKSDKILLGIDLGTTYSCAGVNANEGRITILKNELGNSITASCVSFSDFDGGGICNILVGDEAKFQAALHPSRTIFEVKRLIGRQFNDPFVQADLPRWPFKVVPGEFGMPMFEIENAAGNATHYTPEKISSLVLSKLKNMAEKAVGQEVKDAVITVPANFTNSQREATKVAAAMAGLYLLQMVNEPTAAALAYGLDKKLKWDGSETVMAKNVLVYDLGGGTFDVTILSIDINVEIHSTDDPGSYFDVLGTDGDTHLGGQDFDNRLVQHFLSEFQAQTQICISEADLAAYSRLRKTAERAKCTLSTQTEVNVLLEDLHSGLTLAMTVSRTQFENMCGDLFSSTIELVHKLIHESCSMQKSAIQEVVLIGGSTRIPKIRQLLAEYFDGEETELNWSINPDEAVAIGATLLAATLVPSKYPLLDFCLTDVTSLSLGIEVQGYKMSTLIKRFTPIPTNRPIVQHYTTVADNQTMVAVVVYEGESAVTAANNRLGKFVLHEIPPAPKGVPLISIQFEIDGNGILHVSATESSTGQSKSISIKRQGAKFEQKTFGPGTSNSNNLMRAKEPESRAKFENYVCKVRTWMFENTKIAMGLPNSKFVIQKCDEAIQWLDANPHVMECDNELREIKGHFNLPGCIAVSIDLA